MRTVEEIRADLPRVAFATDRYVATRKSEQQYEIELRAAITTDIPIDRLKAICAAEKDGRLVTLPCKVDDTVYVISGHGARSNPKIVERTVYSFYVEENGRVMLKLGAFDGCYSDELGKITGSPFWEGYYLTRAEAEAALKESNSTTLKPEAANG